MTAKRANADDETTSPAVQSIDPFGRLVGYRDRKKDARKERRREKASAKSAKRKTRGKEPRQDSR
jgi:hypothetical protein